MYPAFLNAIGINNIHPGMIMMLFGILIWILPAKFRKPLSLIAPMAAGVGFFLLNENSTFAYRVTKKLTIELIHVDRLAMAFMLVFVLIAMIAAVYSMEVQDKSESGMSAFYAGSMMGVVLAGDSISLIFFWEISAFASAYLIYARHCRKSSRAAFRYLLMHSFGGNMLLVGIIIHVAKFGTTLTNISGQHGISFWLILIGVAVNVAIPPLNGWLPDAYPEATIAGTLYMGSFTTKAAVYALIRLFAGTDMLIWVGAFMAVYAACMAILENDMRRLLSYHIISQLGMMVAALALGTEIGVDGASAHATTNILFKGVLLMGAGAVLYATGKSKITELGGLAKKMPITSICFLIASLAIAGLPFSSGFASKALVTESLIARGYIVPYLLVTAAGVGTLLSITLKINYFVFFGKSDADVTVSKIPLTMKVAMIFGTLATLVIGFFPKLLYRFTINATMVNPFTINHILEYVAIFVGGTIPFLIYIRRMKPHDEISIDFDWLYRRPLNKLVQSLSASLNTFMNKCDSIALHGMRYLGSHLGDPYLWTRRSHEIRIRSMSFENEDRLIGDVIQVVISVTAIIMIVVMAV